MAWSDNRRTQHLGFMVVVASGGLVAPLLLLAGIGGLAASWVVRSPRSLTMQLLGLGSVIVAAGIPEAVNVHLRQYYSTDSAAFNQVAARILLHGHNPYTTTMASAARLLQVPAHNWTYTVNGGHVTSLSYPAGSFLLQVPAMALGFHHEVVDWMDLYAWLITGVLLFVLIPATVRWLAALLILTPIFVQMFSAGGTDAAFVPFLVLAVWRWDRFHLGRSAGVARWIGPIALGLACSIKQTPWFCLPFLVVGLFIEARNTGRRPVQLVMRYLAIVVAVFVVVNIPFIVWQPTAWARGTFLPFTDPLVADGQGLVTLVLHGVARGASLPLLTVAGVLVFVALDGRVRGLVPPDEADLDDSPTADIVRGHAEFDELSPRSVPGGHRGRSALRPVCGRPSPEPPNGSGRCSDWPHLLRRWRPSWSRPWPSCHRRWSLRFVR